MDDFSLFAACAPGFEPFLATEVAALGVVDPLAEAGGVSFRGDLATLYRANLELGLSSQVLVRVADFPVRHFAELVRKVSQVPWETWLAGGAPLRVKVTARRSRLMHTGGIAERVRLGIDERLGIASPTASDDTGVVTVQARMVEDHCTLSIDTSGEPLHRRGYRLASGKAPLREDFARALLIASGWDRCSPLADPMMGSGTLVIEAAMLGRRLPPGGLRGFAFERLANFDAACWQGVRQRAQAAVQATLAAPIFGSDRDPGAVAAATANAERAGVAADVQLAVAPLSAAPFAGMALGAEGALVTNPPHGRRIGEAKALVPLHQRLGHLVRELPPTWHVALFSSDRRLALATGLALRSAALVDQGGTKARILVKDPG